MDILWVIEVLIAFAFGVLFALALLYVAFTRDADAQKPPAIFESEPECVECETCGSVTAHLVEGMCGVCQRMYRK